jgi:hypothetical protein
MSNLLFFPDDDGDDDDDSSSVEAAAHPDIPDPRIATRILLPLSAILPSEDDSAIIEAVLRIMTVVVSSSCSSSIADADGGGGGAERGPGRILSAVLTQTLC